MMYENPKTEIQKTENQISELVIKLQKLRKDNPPEKVKNYKFQNLEGDVTLLDLFAGKDKLFVIHNMGQACRYCTTWADGINPFVQHLEDKFSIVLVSKDPPELQRRFANSRGWRYRTASHGGGDYIKEQSVVEGQDNMPGMVVFERNGDQIYRKNAAAFGPGDLFCSIWHILNLGGIPENEFTPQYNYWQKPTKMDDGGKNLL